MAVKRLLCLAVLLISALHVSPPLAYGQPKKLFTLTIRDAYLTELFLQIEKQSNYSFVYQTDDIEALGKKNFSCVRSDLEAILKRCFTGTDLVWEIPTTMSSSATRRASRPSRTG